MIWLLMRVRVNRATNAIALVIGAGNNDLVFHHLGNDGLLDAQVKAPLGAFHCNILALDGDGDTSGNINGHATNT